ncbi:hypothetical protein C8Q76DRAFT_706326 [Earliella scabrosa]|nr:hypothetical protein C8Q76DRAFT_706326 [Earliella scabrosa]
MRTRKSPDMHPITLPLLQVPRNSPAIPFGAAHANSHAQRYTTLSTPSYVSVSRTVVRISCTNIFWLADTTASFIQVGSARSTNVSFTTVFSPSA